MLLIFIAQTSCRWFCLFASLFMIVFVLLAYVTSERMNVEQRSEHFTMSLRNKTHNHVINIRCVRILKHWNIPIILKKTQNSFPVCGNVLFVYFLYVHVMGFYRNVECIWKCIVKIAATESEEFSRNMKRTKVSKAHEYLNFCWICARRSCTWVNTLCKMWPDKVWKFTELEKKNRKPKQTPNLIASVG